MNEELTNEVLEVMKKCSFSCALCGANGVCDKYDWQDTIQTLATALLEERAKPKYDVWENAPDWAISAVVFWESQAQRKRRTGPVFNRELPKTRIDEIADEVWHEINKGVTGLPNDIIKRWLKKYAEELKGEA